MRGAADTEKYKFKIVSCCLFVKLVTLSDPIYRGLKSRMDGKEKLVYHYRRLSMKSDVINAHSILYESGNLFPGTNGA